QQGVSNIILAMTRRDVGKPAFSLRKKTLRENTCAIASGDYSTPVSQRLLSKVWLQVSLTWLSSGAPSRPRMPTRLTPNSPTPPKGRSRPKV
ncbi:MAG: hypothetical protein ACXW1Z_19395, partial [Methylobacter sp.]